jgi:hypothetical protein
LFFLFHRCVCFKHNLSKLIDNFYGAENRGFLPIAYDLSTNVGDFVGHFFLNDKKDFNEDEYKLKKSENINPNNTWIIKPWNLSRGMEITVSSSLPYILKISENEPKLVCQCILIIVAFIIFLSIRLDIERPLLFNGKKFDIV